MPIIFFPYPCSALYQLPVLEQVHPLIFEDDQNWNDPMRDSFCILEKWHPIVQGFAGNNLLECDFGYRDAARPKQQSTVIATWHDGVPLLAELGNTMCCNFSLGVTEKANKLILGIISYLLEKREKRHWKLFPICNMYTDVRLVVT